MSASGRLAPWAVAGAALLVAACGSSPAARTEEAGQGGPTAQGDGADVAVLQAYLDLAFEKMDQGAIGEGIHNFVAILAEIQRAGRISEEARQFGVRAEGELSKIGSGLALSPGGEWMDADRNQISASTLEVGTSRALSPNVTLTYAYGGTRTLVSGAPVVFEFAAGSGALVTPVATNEYGQANTTVTSLDDAKAENVIRATVSYRVQGFVYSFPGASRDFAYVPPVRRATILVLERASLESGETYVSAEPVALDRTYNVLRGVPFGYTPYNGRLLGDRYMRVFGGEGEAIRSLGLEEGVSYLIMVLSDAYYVRQVELNGKKYELYTTKTNATTRVVRAADGAILYSGTVQAVDGQGNTGEKAIVDGFRNAAARMAEKLAADLDQIGQTLLGG